MSPGRRSLLESPASNPGTISVGGSNPARQPVVTQRNFASVPSMRNADGVDPRRSIVVRPPARRWAAEPGWLPFIGPDTSLESLTVFIAYPGLPHRLRIDRSRPSRLGSHTSRAPARWLVPGPHRGDSPKYALRVPLIPVPVRRSPIHVPAKRVQIGTIPREEITSRRGLRCDRHRPFSW